MFKKIGPGVLVAAAFIGPGPLPRAPLPGLNLDMPCYGPCYFPLLRPLVLQEMAARLGLLHKKGWQTL